VKQRTRKKEEEDEDEKKGQKEEKWMEEICQALAVHVLIVNGIIDDWINISIFGEDRYRQALAVHVLILNGLVYD
jgi:predicted RNA-binding protein Jag